MASHEVAHGHGHSHVAHHFEDAKQQRNAASLGMWLFLANEVLLFGGLFAAYAVYRALFPQSFTAANELLNEWLGAFNTAVLLCSSLTVALAIHAAQVGSKKGIITYIVLTMIFGTAFLGIKAYEWYHEYEEGLVPVRQFENWTHFGEHSAGAPGGPASSPHAADPANPGAVEPHGLTGSETAVDANKARLFYNFYFTMTGLHALHMVIGLGLFIWMLVLAMRNRFSPDNYSALENVGLYWHFVDVVWVFLFPIIYLI